MEKQPILKTLDQILKSQNQILFYVRVIAEQSSIPATTCPETWLDDTDVLFRLKISRRTLARHRKEGLLPSTQVKRKHYYKESDVIAFLTNPNFNQGAKKPGRKRKNKP